MPKYPYLNDAAKFDAESLNTRFDDVAAGVNVVTEDAIALRGLNHHQVPSMLGALDDRTDTFTTENEELVVTIPSQDGSPPGIPASIPRVWTRVARDGYELLLRDGGPHYNLDTVGKPTALLVFANVEVKHFTGFELVHAEAPEIEEGHDEGSSELERYYGINLNEYTWEASVAIELQDSAGTTAVITRTTRQVSPRVTIGYSGNFTGADPPVEADVTPDDRMLEGRLAMSPLRDMSGPDEPLNNPPSKYQFDWKTFQDVSIRTVITKADLTSLSLIDVRYVRMVFTSFSIRSYRVQRANLTVLPIMAKVNS